MRTTDPFSDDYVPFDPSAYEAEPHRGPTVRRAFLIQVCIVFFGGRFLTPSYDAIVLILAATVVNVGFVGLRFRQGAAPVVVDAPGIYLVDGDSHRSGVVPWDAISEIVYCPTKGGGPWADGVGVHLVGQPGHAIPARPLRHWRIHRARFEAAVAGFAPAVPVLVERSPHDMAG
jgi:hypothetical protein